MLPGEIVTIPKSQEILGKSYEIPSSTVIGFATPRDGITSDTMTLNSLEESIHNEDRNKRPVWIEFRLPEKARIIDQSDLDNLYRDKDLKIWAELTVAGIQAISIPFSSRYMIDHVAKLTPSEDQELPGYYLIIIDENLKSSIRKSYDSNNRKKIT